MQGKWLPSDYRTKSSHIKLRKKSFVDFQSTEPIERKKGPSRLSFEEYANLLLVQRPVHSMRKHRDYKQMQLQKRAKIITLTESGLYAEEFRKDSFLSFKKAAIFDRDDDGARLQTETSSQVRPHSFFHPSSKLSKGCGCRHERLLTSSSKRTVDQSVPALAVGTLDKNSVIQLSRLTGYLRQRQRSMVCGWQQDDVSIR